MMINVYILLVANTSSNPLNKFVAQKIREVEKVGEANHVAIAVEYESNCLVFHSVFPRPKTLRMQDFLRYNKPVLVYRREIKNQILMFEMMMWLSITGTNAVYGIIENVLILIKRSFTELAEYINVIKTNHSKALNCTEYALKFLAWAWPQEFKIERNEDSLGIREIVDSCNKSLLLLRQDQVNDLVKKYS